MLTGTTEVTGYVQNNKAMGSAAPWKNVFLKEVAAAQLQQIGALAIVDPAFSNISQKSTWLSFLNYW